MSREKQLYFTTRDHIILCSHTHNTHAPKNSKKQQRFIYTHITIYVISPVAQIVLVLAITGMIITFFYDDEWEEMMIVQKICVHDESRRLATAYSRWPAHYRRELRGDRIVSVVWSLGLRGAL